VGKNWRWRVKERQLSDKLRKELLRIAKLYGRCNWEALSIASPVVGPDNE
jgi:4-alpha-glucanotransferase